MQTQFSEEQLKDPRLAEANGILRNCVHCGFCTATCPTYVLLGDELDSPRGRIYLIKEMLESGQPARPEVVKHVDRCLSCLSCMTTCPASVNYMHLVDEARAYINETYQRPLIDRMLRYLLALILPEPARFRRALQLASLGRGFAGMLDRLPALKPLAAMLRLAPASLPPRQALGNPGSYPAEGRRRGRVALLTGCAQSVLDPNINAASIRVLTRSGFDVVVNKEMGCCGALTHHLGNTGDSHARAKRNVDVWMDDIEAGGLDAIIINTSGCGTAVKDYGYMLRLEPAYAEKAAKISAITRDICEFLAEKSQIRPEEKPNLRVAYHAACSLQHGQKITRAPKQLLADAGFEVIEVPEGHLCCGSAGTYNILQPQIATRLRDRKLDNIASIQPDIIAAGNIGCITQIASGTAIPVVHTVELLDWASGGPPPASLKVSAQ